MLDLENIGAEAAEPGGDLPEHAGPVGNGQAEGDDTVLALELAHHHRGKNARVDVAAAQDQPHLAAAEPVRPGQHGAEPGRAGAFRHRLLQGEIGVDRPLEMRLVDQHDLGDELAHDRQRQHADVLDRDAFRQRRAAEGPVLPAERVPERGIKRRLHPDDLDRGRPRARRNGVAGDQPAAADRDHQHLEVVGVFQHFQRDGPLARDHQGIVVGVHEGEVALAGQGLRRAPAPPPRFRRRARPRRRGPASPRSSRTGWSPASRWWPGFPAARRGRRPPGHGCRRTSQ